MTRKIIIIGGGAAGMMAAYHAKVTNPSLKVILIEKNNYLGAKVIISGGGRCNVTTGVLDLQDVLKNYPRGADFLKTAFYGFPPQAVIDFFECLGVPLKTEADLRVFPVSNNGKDFVAVLENVLRENGVEIILKAQVDEVRIAEKTVSEGKFIIKFKDGRELQSDALILTTGGQAYRHTGSTGDGYAFAMSFGHTITDLAPSLNSFIFQEAWLADLAGISFKKVCLSFNNSYERTGPILFTHKGLTGPAVFALSALAAFEKYGKDRPALLSVDFFPETSSDELERRLMGLFEQYGGKLVVNVLDMLLPKAIAEKVLLVVMQSESSNLNIHSLVASKVSKVLRKKIVLQMKNFQFTVIGRGAGDEFVTAGGIKLEEVQAKTMESKICSGLYFAGEILNIDGFTGGFNLQASWATGALAGIAAAEALG